MHESKSKEKIKMKTIDLGDACIYCMNSTSAGSGRFCNRVPSDSEWEVTTFGGCGDTYIVSVIGWACAECQALPCNKCDARTVDYIISDDGEVLCEECFKKEMSNV